MWDCLDVPSVFIFPERRRDTLMTVMHHLHIVIQYERMHICKYLAAPHVCNAWYYMWWIGSASLEFHAMNLNFEVRSLHIDWAVWHSCGAGNKWMFGGGGTSSLPFSSFISGFTLFSSPKGNVLSRHTVSMLKGHFTQKRKATIWYKVFLGVYGLEVEKEKHSKRFNLHTILS